MFEDIYFWKKNGRPDTEKDHYTNSACHNTLRHLKTEKMILKTYHMDFGEGQCTKKSQELMDRTVLSQDLAPYVRYSVNRKKRWEAEAGVELLGELQKMYDDMDVLVMERAQFRGSSRVCSTSLENYYFNHFPIRRVHAITDDHSYQCTSVDSVRGQKIQHFSLENRSPAKETQIMSKSARRPKVAYHFITPPKNYETFLQKKFHPGRLRLKWWWPLDYVKVDFRPFIDEDLYEAITYDGLMDKEWDDIHEWDEEEEDDDGRDHPKKCYNLVDHFVEDWTIVKRKKNNNRVQ